MRKFIKLITVGLVVLLVGFSIPPAYERLLPVNGAAAFALNDLEQENIGKSVVDCLNGHNRVGVWWDLLPTERLKAYEDLEGPWTDTYYVISGRTGWSTSWAAILPLEAEMPSAYDTFGVDGANDGGIHRIKVPKRIIGTLKRCGVAFLGTYPNELPI